MSRGSVPIEQQRRAAGPLGYQPSLDGIRAGAIVLVLLFHTDRGGHVSVLKGGFLGVDVFFVLSGFLITSLLIGERRATDRIRILAFWGRRIARLFPLLWALLALMAIDRWLLDIRGLEAPSPLGFLALFGYVGNWIPATGRDGLGKLEYLWSLSVEEQFYVVWPLIVMGVLALAARRNRSYEAEIDEPGRPISAGEAGVAIVAVLGAAAVITARVLTHTTVEYFFHTGLRSDGLLLGAALAATRPFWHRMLRLSWANALVVLGALAVAWVVWTSWVGHPEVPTWKLPLLEVGVLALTAGLVAHPAAVLARSVGSRPLVWLGRRAYALYLVHVPIFDITRAYVGEERPRVKVLIGWPLAFLAAHLAHIAIEIPAQRWLRRVLHADHVKADPAPADIDIAAGT